MPNPIQVIDRSQTLLTSDVYSIRTIDSFLWAIKNDQPEIHVKRLRGFGSVEYLQIAAAFDIETTSTYIDGKKAAFMYCWQFCINGYVIMGRYWEEFRYLMTRLRDTFGLGAERKMFCFVHSLSYEFQFMRKWFSWSDVFALESLTPLSAEMSDYGIIFRCSYLLTGCGLAALAKKLNIDGISKRMGQLKYDLIHTPETPLTDAEKDYCIIDVLIIVIHIAQCMEYENGVENIPRTKTGYVRRLCRDSVLYHKEIADKKQRDRAMFAYRKLMTMLKLTVEEYQLCKDAFAGGFTHANCFHVDEIINDVASFDFSSSYPACAVLDYFPKSRGSKTVIRSEEEYRRLCRAFCVIADVKFYNLQPKIDFEFYLSKSKCREYKYIETTDPKTGRKKKRIDGLFDNGRLVSCAECVTSITEIDFDIIDRVYTWDKMEIGTAYTYARGRLPSDFVKVIADLYEAKTTLKGVAGMEKEYMLMKEDLNSLYGMMVTDIIRTIYEYGFDDWKDPYKPDLSDKIDEYNKSFSRFTFYPHGLYITAHARRRLWSGILECRHDFVYADTDSLKITNAAAHIQYIERYNAAVLRDLKTACAFHDIPLEKFTPKTIKGEMKVLGYWDYEGTYKRFKTLGAKRYMRETESGDILLTVAGVNPKNAAKYIVEKYGRNGAFTAFNNELSIPAEHTGKMTHTYIDQEIEGDIMDYTGRMGHFHELSFIHLEKAPYNLSISEDFFNFLKGVKQKLEI